MFVLRTNSYEQYVKSNGEIEDKSLYLRLFSIIMCTMTGFCIHTTDNQTIRFYYYQEAPITVAAFAEKLPFTRTFVHARVSGEEFWTDDAPVLDIIQENASVFTEVGEVVIGTLKPLRNKTTQCMGVYYGAGKGLDACNIFAKVWEEDLSLLQMLGEKIWKQGAQTLTFQTLPTL